MSVQLVTQSRNDLIIQDCQVSLSVIVPVYRVEKYLVRCLDSLCAQNMMDVEFILVDDGSPDRCGDICDEYALKDHRFKTFHKENGGLSSARNYGIERAQGKYLMFVDSDDWVLPTFCSTAYNLAVKHDSDMVVFMFQIVEGKRYLPAKVNHLTDGLKSRKEALDLLFDEPGVFAWNKLYTRALFDDVRYPIGRVYEDQAVTWKLVCNAERIYYTNQVLYYYFMRSTSIMHQETVKTAKDKFEMKLQLYNGLKKTGYSSEKFISLLPACAMSYAMRVKKDPNDETGVRAHEILNNFQTIPKAFLWQQKIMFFLYKKNMHLFDMACVLSGKRIA